MPLRNRFLLSTVVLLTACVGKAIAGGGPENVCLVVNPNSPESLAIANHYMQLRAIPANNVVYLMRDPNADVIDIAMFRTQMLATILETLDRRKLGGQIDYIVYSSGFPWRVSFASDVNALDMAAAATPATPDAPQQWPKVFGRAGSLTGLTYLFQHVMRKNLAYAVPTVNRYMRPIVAGKQTEPTMGFRGTDQFDASGRLVASEGDRYLLSAVLAVTPNEKRYGLSVEETIAYLGRAAKADGTMPAGKVYFTSTSDPRSKERLTGYPPAREALHEMGLPTEVVNAVMPKGTNNVLGLTCGASKFNWAETGSTLLPGALCDNLTSFGGVMHNNHSQTTITEFIRHGAAGASGTVTEPYLILAKFPSPMLHAHYARGCSMAEAFYQSIHGPGQQLIMGDPLCQPFARIPEVTVADLQPGQKLSGTLTLRPEARIPPRQPFRDPNAAVANDAANTETAPPTDDADPTVDRFELFVDGVRAHVAKPGEPLSLDTTQLGDGYHELRIVAVGPAPICTQGRHIVWIVTE
ncbi:MAG: hypothetical protein GX621_11905, partial [Pirellulaceae bacterium]|nr:hypothetical protein [Pirellulaceae bacterium]